MIEKFEYKGLWFLPSADSRKVHGILKYDYENNISVLELLGSFYDYGNHEGEDIILGVTTDGDEITLSDCQFSSSTGIAKNESDKFTNWNEDRLCTLNFRIKSIFKGQHIFKIEDLVFQKIYTEIFNFDEWMGISGFEVNNDYQNNSKTIFYKTPESINLKINEDVDMEIKFISNHPMRMRFSKELKLKQHAILSFHSKKYITLNEFFYLLKKFNNFLSTSLQKPVRIETVELYCDKFIEQHGNDTITKAIDAYQIINPELKFEEKKHDWEMLFTFNDIRNDFDIIMRKWFSNYDKYEAPFNLVLSQYYVSKYFLESLFINVAQAAESFHRRLDLIDDIPKTEQDEAFNIKVNRIIENAPAELKNWVKSQISKPPKHFYDTRLKYLLKEFSNSELDKMIGHYPDFVKDISISRNYYTHYNRDLEIHAAHGIDLVFLYEKLRLLLICSFLIESGFSKPLLEKLIREKSSTVFRYLRN